VAAPLPFAESELRILRVLLKREVRFMVVGLSAATLQGAPVVTQDVDLWFENLGEDKISLALREVGAAYVPSSINNPPMLAGPGAELFDIVIRMDGLTKFADELKNCVEIPLDRYKLKVLSIERILASKIAANRPKDRLTVPVLRDALVAAQAPKLGPAKK
jgi:predicted nucleotidyltransferase